ncbi:hypothetical protein, partial [Phenylobacterium aquaticum]
MSMSVSGFNAASLVSSTPTLATSSGQPQTPAEKAKAAADAAKAAQQQLLDEVKRKGLYAWAQEQKFEALKAKIRAQILQEKGLTEEGLAGMDQTSRTSMETAIQEEITRRIKDVMKTELEGKAHADAKAGKP